MLLEKLLFKSGLPHSESERRKVLLGGYFLLISITCSAVFLIANLFNPKGTLELLYLSVAMGYSLTCLWLLRNEWKNTAIIAHLLFTNALVFLFTYLDPEQYQTGTYIFFILNAFGALSIFGFRELWKGVFFTSLSFVLFLISMLKPERFHPADAHFYLVLNFLFILLIGSLILLFYDKQVIRSEELLQLKNSELKKINTELDRFVYSASHDLRAPLSSILGLIKLYQMSTDTEKDKMVELINNRVMKLDEFIKEIIQYSRNARVEIAPTKIDIQNLIQSCWDTLQFMPQASGIRFINETPSPLTVMLDPDRLRIILENIISNGIKYSKSRPEGSFIKIHAVSNGIELIIEVIDNGIGISKEKQEKVFDMFYRAHDHSDGSGLGLFIVNETIQKMNGSIQLESTESKGTVFKIQIPIIPQTEFQPGPATSSR